jgi:cupin fold WbuC family metalloprotein
MHQNEMDAIQRLFVSMLPESYIRPHRHSRPGAWESFILLAGDALCLVFDDEGKIAERVLLGKGNARSVEIEPGAWHSLLSLCAETLLLELKPGPYAALAPADCAAWAPAEGAATCAELLAWERKAKIGEAWK